MADMKRLLAFAALVAAAPFAQVGDSMLTILRALELPALVTEARRVGVTEVRVRDVLEALRARGLPAEDAARVVREEIDAIDAGAPRDNFGAFVHAQLDAGLRGRALAEAIRAEHQARDVGRPEGRGARRRANPRSGGSRL
jgi:hypothetical protein